MSSQGAQTLAIELPAIEKPQNGIAGLKHWRYDLLAGLQVALVGLPLSLGIAVASGAPPITGVISAIVGGLIYPFLGGSFVTISGPAAGLAPALLAGMLTLGHGDLTVGYPLLLVAICFTGIVQVILSRFGAGKFGLFFPISVVEGMLAAIGVMIIVKMIPNFVGHLTPPVKSIPLAIAKFPENFLHMTPTVFLIGGISLGLLTLLYQIKHRAATLIPPPLLVVGLGMLLGWLLDLTPDYLIKVPSDILNQGMRLPDFQGVFGRPDLWLDVLLIVVTVTLIDGTESIATVAAIDKIDPFRRRSDPNKTLQAMGISNLLSSLVGGLTIIPGGMKSTVNIVGGGRTLWSNGYYGLTMLLLLVAGTGLINRIPLATLAALLMFVGYRLCAIRVFKKIFGIGKEQLLIFVVTMVVTLVESDLLLGIAIGMLTKLAALVFHLVRSPRSQGMSAAFVELFSNPVIRIGDGRVPNERYTEMMSVATSAIRGTAGEMKNPYKIYLSSVTCMNLMKLDKALSQIVVLPNTKANYMVIMAGQVIDHTAMEYLHNFQDQCIEAGHTCALVGMDHFRTFSDHVLAYRVKHTLRDSVAYA
ncbi:MAG TPA: SulP family inorganic anion transporter [Nitrospiraceae bacterium]|nr:SulP family inorganic anion transporter [Nitrospiraceae bacterium]